MGFFLFLFLTSQHCQTLLSVKMFILFLYLPKCHLSLIDLI